MKRGAAALALALAHLAAPAEGARAAALPELDRRYRQALDLLYDGQADGALARLARIGAEAEDDPVGAYLEALALCWKLEQRPDVSTLDRELERRVQRAVGLADARLRRDPDDRRALLARGAAHGVASRLYLFRLKSRDAARAAERMRTDLMAVQAREPGNVDARFGLGLYDYYMDVLPRGAKVLRFLMGMPGGDRRRGLAAIEAAAASTLHDVEAQVQLYEVYAFYEEDPDRALVPARALHARYPGWALWALKRAEHERDRLGLYAASAAVARAVLETEEERGAGTGPAAALARLSLGESLLLDQRPGEARQVLLPLRRAAAAGAVGARAAFLLGRSLELEGDREGAAAHYRTAASGGDKEVRRRAQRALATPLAAGEVKAGQLIGQARRAREAGDVAESARLFRAALESWPRSLEAELRVAEDELHRGLVQEARPRLRRLAEAERPQPPWVAAWARLLRARLHDMDGARADAVVGYRHVLEAPFAQDELRRAATEGMRHAYGPARDAKTR
jgi:hypothetical protein